MATEAKRVFGGEGGQGRQPLAGFKFEIRRIDEACIACFVPNCETPIKDGYSQVDIHPETREPIPAGDKVPSILNKDGVTYRADAPREISYFSAQSLLVVDLGSEGKDPVQDVWALLTSQKIIALLDDRDKRRVRVYLGSCTNHFANLEDLRSRVSARGNKINQEILEEVIGGQ